MTNKQAATRFFASLAAIAALTVTAGAQPTSAPGVAAPGAAAGVFVTSSRFSEPTGEAMYARVCAGCHMPDGKGAVGAGFYPSLAKNEKLASSAYPVMVLTKGLNGMPPLGNMMTDSQVADVVNYVRTNFGNKYRDRDKPADVGPLR